MGANRELSVFIFDDYVRYLEAYRLSLPQARQRGFQRQLATELHCQSAWLSRVFQRSSDLTLEQGERINHFCTHDENESAYLLDLILEARAGTPELKKFHKSQRLKKRDSFFNLKTKIPEQKVLDESGMAIYYSNIEYALVHAALSISKFQDNEILSAELGIPAKRLRKILSFLESYGLIYKARDKWEAGKTQIHLNADSPYVSRHHLNLRLKACESIQNRNEENLHYSSVVSISKEGQAKAKDIMMRAIQEIRNLVKDSTEECLAGYNLDFFSLQD